MPYTVYICPECDEVVTEDDLIVGGLPARGHYHATGDRPAFFHAVPVQTYTAEEFNAALKRTITEPLYTAEEVRAHLQDLASELFALSGAEAEACEFAPNPIAEGASNAYMAAVQKVEALSASLSTQQSKAAVGREGAE